MLTKSQARQRIVERISSWSSTLPADDEFVIVDAATIERPWGWVFFYTSRMWHETGDVRHAVAGNAPFIVNKHDGTIQDTGTAYPIEHYLAQYEATLSTDEGS